MKMEPRKIQSTNRGFSIQFENGYAISVVTHEMAYCGPGTAEIAIVYVKDDDLVDPSVIGEDWGDTVKGWVTPDELASYIAKVQSIRNTENI